MFAHALVEQKRIADAEGPVSDWLLRRPDDARILALKQHVVQADRRWLDSLVLLGRSGLGGEAPGGESLNEVFAAFFALGWIGIADALQARILGSAAGAEDEARLSWVLSSLAFERRDFVKARQHLHALLSDTSISPRMLHSMSMRLLALGELELGWQVHHARTKLSGLIWDEALPRWSGEALTGKHILVFSEQGAGDVIQFLRFVPMLAARDIHCTFVAYDDIVSLLAAVPGAETREVAGVAPDAFDCQLQLLDLPMVCGVRSVADIPAQLPYLHARPADLAQWQERLRPLPGVKIGLAWAGNPSYGNDHWRSSSLRELAGLAAIPGVTWISLQKGAAGDELPPEDFPLRSFTSELERFTDTAALIEALDLVISVDTSVAHLAGALGKPVWILLPERGKDWRWFLEEQTSPWYPSARLFTQRVAGRWDFLVKEQLRPALAGWLSAVFAHGASPSPASVSGLPPAERDWLLRYLQDAGKVAAAVDVTEFGAPLERDRADALMPFARVLARVDASSALLDAVAPFAGEAGQMAMAEQAARDERRRAESIEGLRQLRASGTGLGLSATSALVQALLAIDAIAEATSVLREAEASFQDHPALLPVAALLAEKRGRSAVAIRRLRTYVEQYPRDMAAHQRLYELYRAAGDSASALQHLQRAILLSPEDLTLQRHVVRELRSANCLWLVGLILEEIHRAEPTESNALACAAELLASGRRDEAQAMLCQIAEPAAKTTDYALAFNRVMFHRAAGNWPDVLAGWRLLRVLRPQDKGLLFSLGWDLLSLGQIEEGWRCYAEGLADKTVSRLPLWDGSVHAGMRVVVYQDQGQGDVLQFCTLMRRLPDAVRFTLAVTPRMRDFLRAQVFPCRVIGTDEVDWNDDEFDARIPLMALPSLVGADLLTPPTDYPYLRPDSQLLPAWRRTAKEDAGLKVGIVWAGNPGYGNDAFRSTRLKDWTPLLGLDGICFYSLQKDIASNQAFALPGFSFRNIIADCDSWQKTATALSLLDLVISVDSGVLHLAGALGVEAWALLPSRGLDFRWLREREDCPWYPSLTLIRQSPGEPWLDVLGRVAQRLVERKGLAWRA